MPSFCEWKKNYVLAEEKDCESLTNPNYACNYQRIFPIW